MRAKTKSAASTKDLGAALETLVEIESALGDRASACGRFRRSIALLAPLSTPGTNVTFHLKSAREKVSACPSLG